MKRNHVRLGPFALLLAVISMCMAVLSVLSLSTALADMRLSERYAETVSVRYELEYEGQKFLDSVRKDTSLFLPEAATFFAKGTAFRTASQTYASHILHIIPSIFSVVFNVGFSPQFQSCIFMHCSNLKN